MNGQQIRRGDVAAIVLAGGKATRLGQDKALARVAGQSMLDHVLSRLPSVIQVVVVGPDEAHGTTRVRQSFDSVPVDRGGAVSGSAESSRRVTRTCERPPGGGPVAGLAAALELVWTPNILLLAVDMPLGVHAALMALEKLVGYHSRVEDSVDGPSQSSRGVGPETDRGEFTAGVAAVIPVDAGGRRQPLCGAYRTEALRLAMTALVSHAGGAAGASMRSLLARLEVMEIHELPAPVLLDVDTAVDLAVADVLLRSPDWGSPEPG